MPPKTFYVGVDPDEPYSIKGRVTQYTSIKDGVELPIGSLVQRWDTVAPVGPTFIPAVDVEPWRQVGDPDADEVLEILGLGPGVDALNAVQAEATKEGGNPKVKAFWQKVLAGPEGKVDHQLIKEGQGIYHKYSIHFFFALLYNSLIGGFASPNFNGVLRETGYMTSAHKEATWKRLLETTIFFIDVRRKILLGKGRVNKYDHAAFGVPINQRFTLGIQPHILDRICHPSYIDTEISFISLFFAVFPRDAPSQPPTSTATTTYGLLNAVNGRPPLAKARMEFHVEFTRSLLGPEFADQLALPKGNLFDRLGENKTCIDCDVPMPQWASLSFGVFCCLTCSGAHRGLGVHISFVRSLTMDKWTEVQVTKMRVGGNKKCREFFQSQPGYSKGMSIQDKYSAHFATQYKDKLLAEIEGREWSPSDSPAPAASNASALRKPRATGGRGPSPTPSRDSGYNQPASPSSPGGPGGSQKSRNEDYFANMGAANDSRSAELPPSQGGKYGGFGSDASYNPSNSTSSRALPSMDDLRDDPVSALGRGWGFLGAALTQASRSINENVLQPTLERAGDPALSAQFSTYVSRAGTVLSEGARVGGGALASGLQAGSTVLKRDLGVDVGDLGATHVERFTGRGAGQGYGQVGIVAPSAEAQGDGDDFFGNQLNTNSHAYGGGPSPGSSNSSSPAPTQSYDAGGGDYGGDSWAKLAPNSSANRASALGATSSGRSSPAAKKPEKPVKKDDDWDDWKD
ncbi:hypothetical protein RQP46_004898 [Phenoliferia psychrophenolica]